MKTLVIAIIGLSSVGAFATTISVTNNRGPANTREVTAPAGVLVAGFGAFGILNESGFNGLSTTFDGLDFVQFGLGGGAVSTSLSGQFTFSGQATIGVPAPNTSVFDGRNIYLLVGFGGTNLATSTSLFAYKFNTGFGVADSALPIALTLSSDAGSTLFGTEVGNPSTTASGRYNAAAITAVPEPSAALLGAIGALGLLRRRRN